MTHERRPGRKRIRLDRNVYGQPGSVWHATLSTANRQRAFSDPVAATKAIDVLIDRSEKAGARLLLYCVMPEHVHALIQIEREDLIAIVRAVKSILGIWWKAQSPANGDLWQRSFYDRGIRTEQDLDEVIGYIFSNPVDEGLVADWSEYPLIGETLIDTM